MIFILAKIIEFGHDPSGQINLKVILRGRGQAGGVATEGGCVNRQIIESKQAIFQACKKGD